MTATNTSKGGIAWVEIKVLQESSADEEAYLKWVTKHIGHIAASSGVRSAFFYRNLDPNAEARYLGIYAADDLAFFGSEEFLGIGKRHGTVIETGKQSLEVVDMCVRKYNFVQKYKLDGIEKEVGSLLATSIELGETTTEQEFHDWSNNQLGNLAKIPGYIGSTRLKLLSFKNSTERRTQAGLPPRDEAVAEQKPFSWLAVHEFEDDFDMKSFMELRQRSDNRIIENSAGTTMAKYKLVKGFGEGSLAQYDTDAYEGKWRFGPF